MLDNVRRHKMKKVLSNAAVQIKSELQYSYVNLSTLHHHGVLTCTIKMHGRDYYGGFGGRVGACAASVQGSIIAYLEMTDGFGKSYAG